MGGKGKRFKGGGHASSPPSKHHALLYSTNAKSHHHSSKHEKPFRHPQHPVTFKNSALNAKLPLHLKQPHRMSHQSLKRSRVEDKSGPIKKVKLSGPTGLEGFEELSGDLGMTSPSDKIPLFARMYQCRDKEAERERRRTEAARYARVIKQQRLLSNTTAYTQKTALVKQRGLANITGALCYRHSLFQALLHTPMFPNWLQKNHQAENCVVEGEICVPCALRALAWTYKNGSEDALDGLLKVTNKVFKLNGWSPHSSIGHGDPEEQFTWITSMLSKQLPRDTYRTFKASHCLLTDTVIRCNKCSHESRVNGNLTSALPVALQPRAEGNKLSTYLNQYMREPVEDYRCEKCNDKNDKVRAHQISHSPDLLVVQLLRFDGVFGRKDSTHVHFSTRLSLNAYRSPLNRHDSDYDLLAVVMHSGDVSGGHYRCVAKGGNGAWYDFNDDRVREVNVREATNPKNGWTPYLLFFQRVSD